jgi:hypothetical protein
MADAFSFHHDIVRNDENRRRAIAVIARSEATKQSRAGLSHLDCFVG